MWLTALCLTVSMLGFGLYSARETVDMRRASLVAQMKSLAQNLAAVNVRFLRAGDVAGIEALSRNTATVDGIYAVRVTDLNGHPLSEVINNNGTWQPRYSVLPVTTPGVNGPVSVLQTIAHGATRQDFLAGTAGTLAAWHRIEDSEGPSGWVQVNYRLDTFDQLRHHIYRDALVSSLLAAVATLALLYALLRPSMRALQQATDYAAGLQALPQQALPVWPWAVEIAALGRALNQAALRLREQQVELMNQKFALDQHAIVSITDLNGNITYVNQRFCDISGYHRDEILGQNHRILKSGEHPAAFYEALWSTISAGKVWRGTIKNRRKDGGDYWVSATIVPLMGADDLPRQYIAIRTDITANKILEARLREARDQAQAAAVAKGQFLANMSHEIRTPMNAVLGMIKLLQNTPLSVQQADYVQKADDAARSLLRLLNDILDFSKIEAGKMSLERLPLRLDELMRELSVILSSSVRDKPVELLFDLDPQLPRVVMGDTLRLQQVLLNLCSNAIKFTEKGHVVLRVQCVSQTEDQCTLSFSVEDTGIGIAPENQQRIFEGFSQAEADTTRRFGGTGLGLSISRRLIGLMGGELTLKSSLGQGSTFRFTITLPKATDPKADRATPLQALNILLVDDNPTARQVLAGLVAGLGWKADLANDGEQALNLLQAAHQQGRHYDVIFMDGQLPGMNGWETLRRMQATQGTHAPVMVMLTGYAREDLHQRSLNEQALIDRFLVKPVTASMLHDAVAEVFARRQSASAAASQGTTRPPTEKPLAGLRLLVVEDNPVNQQVASELLRSEGAHVDLADNGQAGVDRVLEALKNNCPFHAVLMDIQMPVMDGYAATRTLRQTLGLTQLPIIAMTANVMPSDREASLAAGMNAHVGKPFDIRVLVSLLMSLTAKPAAPQPTDPAPAPGQSAAPPLADAVDTATALQRLGGNTALYAQLIARFLADLAEQPKQLKAALAESRLDTATHQLHTLKGLAATVGANELAAVAQRCERTVQAARSDPSTALDPQAITRALEEAVARAQRALQTLARAPQAPTVQRPANETEIDLAEGLTRLAELISASDLDALRQFELLRNHKARLAAPEWDALEQALAQLDLPSALALTQALRDQALHAPSPTA
ncbi:MAG: hypothetical protein OHK0048_17270 [Rhodoferax sp.]